MKLNKMLGILLSLLISSVVQANYISGVSLAVGNGPRDGLWGSRISLISDWPVWFKDWPVNLTGYWDASAGYWHTRGDENGNHKAVGVFALAPVFKLQFNSNYTKIFDPYIQGSIGGALTTSTKVGNSNFGGVAMFQDLAGVGIRIGDKKQFDFSYNYLHYSTAGISEPNNGLTALHFVAFTYHFA